MLLNSFKIAFRNLFRYKTYTLINIAGLTVGIGSFIIIFLFVQYELGFDRQHQNYHNIYRIHNTLNLTEGGYTYPTCTSILPVKAAAEVPGVEQYVRLLKAGIGFDNQAVIKIDKKSFKESKIFFADSTLFEIFSFKLLDGAPEKVLAWPNTVVLTKSTAYKYFGDENPIGKVITLTGRQELDFKVTGIAEDVPSDSHIHFDILLSMSTIRNIEGVENFLNTWENDGFYSYLLLKAGANPNEVDKVLEHLCLTYGPEERLKFLNPDLFPLKKIHLYSNLRNEIEPNGNIQQIYIFIIIAIFIIIIASINYINLSTSIAARRSLEVGIRKVFGAARGQLIRQYLSESLILAVISAILAPVMVEIFLPYFNQITNRELHFVFFENLPLILTLAGIILFIGILSGSYPAFVLSSFRPVEVLKGHFEKGKNISEPFRKTLVIFQFAISIILIIGAWTIYQQIIYLNNKPLGFQKENLVIIRNSNNTLTPKLEVFKTGLLQNPAIQHVGASFSVPGGLRPIILAYSDQIPDGEAMNLAGINIDFDYLKTLGIKIIEGRNFDPLMKTDSNHAVILNKRGVMELRIEDNPVGQTIEMILGNDTVRKKVIGIVEDINFEPLYRPTEGAFFAPFFPFYTYIFVRIDGKNKRETLAFLEDKWAEFVPSEPFEYSFLKDDLNSLYRQEEKLGRIILYLSVLAIFIAVLGLYGLSSYAIIQRSREIGIRKVLGASVSNILFLFSGKYLRMIMIANVIAWPVAYLALDNWLNNFIFHTRINFTVFLITALLVTLLALLTVLMKIIQLTRINPVASLKHE